MQIETRPEQAVWLRWHADVEGPALLSGRGAGDGARIERVASCGEAESIQAATSPEGSGEVALGLEAEFVGQAFLFRVTTAAADPGIELGLSQAMVVSGRVLDETSGLGIHGIDVAFWRADRYHSGSATTDALGRFRVYLDSAYVGEYFGRTAANSQFPATEGYVHETLDGQACYTPWTDGGSSCGTSTGILVPQGGVQGLEFRLATGHEIEGVVRDRETAVPVPDASIEIQYAANGGGRLLARTDGEGRFSQKGLASGEWWVIAVASEYQSRWHDDQTCDRLACDPSAVPPLVLTGDGTSTVDFALSPFAYLLVRPTTPIPSSSIGPFKLAIVRNTDGVQIAFGSFPVALGPIKIGPLEPGEYIVQARRDDSFWSLYPSVRCEGNCLAELPQAQRVRISHPGERVSVDIPVTIYPSIRGRITETEVGEGISRAEVRVHAAGDGGARRTLYTDAQGNYDSRPMPPGDYVIHARSSLHHDEAFEDIRCDSTEPVLDCAGATRIRVDGVSGDQVVDLALDQASSLRVRLKHGTTLVDPSQGYFGAYSARVERADGTQVPASVRVDPESKELLLGDLQPGELRLGLAVDGFFAQYLGGPPCPISSGGPFDQCDPDQASLISLGDGELALDFPLTSKLARKVMVVDANTQQGVAGVSIDLWNESGLPVFSTVTDEAGHAWARIPGQLEFSTAVSTLISTDSYAGLVDQVYRDVVCPAGASVFKGNCSLAGATALPFPHLQPDAEPIVFRLSDTPPLPPEIFLSGFE